jgi:hypothetical protein
MQSAREVLDDVYLELRLRLVESAAMLDRLDRAAELGEADVDPEETRVTEIREAINILAEPAPARDRAERVLRVFSEPAD